MESKEIAVSMSNGTIACFERDVEAGNADSLRTNPNCNLKHLTSRSHGSAWERILQGSARICMNS